MTSTSKERPWRWKFCELECDSVALLRCSQPRPWTLGSIYALRAGLSLFVAVRPRQDDPLFPGSWLITDWVLGANAPEVEHVPAMLTDAIRRTLSYFGERGGQVPPAGGMVIYRTRHPVSVWQTERGLTSAGFEYMPEVEAMAGGAHAWHLPAERMPAPYRGRTARGRVRSASGFRRGERP